MAADSIDWVKGQAAIRPGAAALEINGSVTTYRELDEEADEYAAELTRRGVGRGHLLRFPAAFDRTSVVVIVAGPRAGVAVAPRPTYASTSLDLIDEASGGGEPARVVLDTSGTGGRRRSCVLTSGNVAAAVAASRGRLGNGSDDRWLLCLPLHHVAGVSILWRSFEAGGTVVIEAGFDADRVARSLAEGSVTFTSLVPTMLYRILRAHPGPYRNHLGGVLVGGAATGASLVREALDAGLPVLPTYGMTEACSQVATVAPGRARQDLGTVGTPLDTMTVSIRSAQGEPCPAGTTGRIIVAGPAVSPGYLGGPRTTGGHVTGDLGHFDAEGRLVVVGRSDDMVISGGENVVPLAVAEVIEQNPAVHRCAVFGIPDPEWGQVVAAAVTGEALDEQRLRAWAERRLSPAEVPRVWLIKDDLPELDTGKVDTDALRADLAG